MYINVYHTPFQTSDHKTSLSQKKPVPILSRFHPSPAKNQHFQAAFRVFVLVQQLPLITSGIGADVRFFLKSTANLSQKYDVQLKSGKISERIVK